MFFINDFDFIVFNRQLKHGNAIIVHKLCRECTADERRKFFFAAQQVLPGLDDGELIVATFGLHGNDVMVAMSIKPHVQLVDFDLTNAFYGRPQMVLQRGNNRGRTTFVFKALKKNDGLSLNVSNYSSPRAR